MRDGVREKVEERVSQCTLKDYWDRCTRKVRPYHEAPSTKVYFEQEKKLIARFFQPLEGKTLLKTDLWNEAKNTRVLYWVKEQNARAFGVDISPLVIEEARRNYDGHENGLHFLVGDLRDLPCSDNTFDYVYSMGTIEHFPECERAVQEIYRVLKHGGRAIIGVPNKFDPFLRPLQVSLLQKLKLYSFGYEESFSRGELTRVLKKANFTIVGQSSLLFMPGLLRMMDLFLFCHARPLTVLSKLLLSPFRFLYNRWEFFRRHGYLLAFAVKK